MNSRKALWIIGIVLATIVVGSLLSHGSSLIWPIVLIVLYFLPTMIAAERKVPNRGSVLVINLFLGWTFIGWVVALAMAARSVPTASTDTTGTAGDQSLAQ